MKTSSAWSAAQRTSRTSWPSPNARAIRLATLRANELARPAVRRRRRRRAGVNKNIRYIRERGGHQTARPIRFRSWYFFSRRANRFSSRPARARVPLDRTPHDTAAAPFAHDEQRNDDDDDDALRKSRPCAYYSPPHFVHRVVAVGWP